MSLYRVFQGEVTQLSLYHKYWSDFPVPRFFFTRDTTDPCGSQLVPYFPPRKQPRLSNDKERAGEAKDELMRMLAEDELRDAVLLIFANKQVDDSLLTK